MATYTVLDTAIATTGKIHTKDIGLSDIGLYGPLTELTTRDHATYISTFFDISV